VRQVAALDAAASAVLHRVFDRVALMSLPTGIGELIAGKYRVERLLGAGGMGLVFAATHEALHERRAIKLLQPKGGDRAELCERFLREAQTAARLRSEHVARVHDVGTLDGGVPYMVMEYVEGTDLSTFLRRRGPLPVDEAVLYALQACEALAEAHRLGIVHRDIKPANLFVTRSTDGSPSIKVLDFGIAKTASRLTDVGVVLGTPRYMPPEQLRATRDVDARADLWALGIVLYEMLAGRTPFQGTTSELYEAIFERDPAPPSAHRAGLPDGLDAVVLRCLEKHRERRYPHVAALAEALAPFAGEPARALAARVQRVLGVSDAAAVEGVSPAGAGVSRATGSMSPAGAGVSHATDSMSPAGAGVSHATGSMSPAGIPASPPVAQPSQPARGPQTESLVHVPQAAAATVTETGSDTATTILAAHGPITTLQGTLSQQPEARPGKRLYAVAATAWMITTAILAAILLWYSRRPDDASSVHSPAPADTSASLASSAPPPASAEPLPAIEPAPPNPPAPSTSASSRPTAVAARPAQPPRTPASPPRPAPAALPTTRNNF
jgi:serine/threonine-protein kinase